MAEPKSQIIEVTGIDKTATDALLKSHFSSRTHGGEIMRIYHIQGSENALIAFTNTEGVKKALENGPHNLNGYLLTVTEMKNVDISENEVLVGGISTTTSRECLTLYMEQISNYLVVNSIEYVKSWIDSVHNAIVKFYTTIDFNKILEGLEKMPTLDGNDISIERVPSPYKTILVKDLPVSATYDSVLATFEDEQDGGGEVERIQLELEKGTAFVKFNDPSVAKRVVGTEINIMEKTVSVELIKEEAVTWKKKSGRIFVSELSEGITKNNIYIHFQKKRNGGGDIEKVELLPGGKNAMVTFEDCQVAKRVVKVEQILDRKNLKLAFVSRSILIHGLPDGATENMVRVHFEINSNVGGPIKNVKVFPIKNAAMVVFEDLEVAIRVVMTPQKMNGKSLVVTFLNEDDLSKLMTTEEVMPTPDSELSPEVTKNDANDIESRWTKRSIKHRERLLEFVKVLKTNPSKTTKIGTYHVCLENEFKIGEGSDGTKVYVGLSNDGYEVAIKRIDLERCSEPLGDIEKKVLNFPKVRKEKHIVNYRFHKVDDNCKTVYLVLDLHEVNLRDYVKELSADQIIEQGPVMIRQILYGVKTLHCSHPEILHRDLKPSNVLVNVDREMVLADLGISRALPEEQTTYKSGVTGTPGWMAVESLPNNDDEEDADIQVRYKKQSDIQVVGMLSYFILSKGKHPYGNRYNRHPNLSKGKFDLKDLSDEYAKDLITWMLQHDPTKRPDVDECLKHPYLRKAEENFNLVSAVGNIGEIKKSDAASAVVQKLNKLSHFTNWSLRIDPCVMAYMNRHRSYGNDTTDLLRFIRNMTEHWGDKPPPSNVQSAVVKPQEYFQKIFPTLAVELHRIIREDSTWITKENLQGYF